MASYVNLKIYLDDIQIDNWVEIVTPKTKHIPTVNSSKKAVKKRTKIVVKQNPRKTKLFAKRIPRQHANKRPPLMQPLLK